MLCSGGTPARSRLGCDHILWALCGCGSSWWAGLCQRSIRSSATPWTRETSQSWVAGFLSPCTQSLVVAVQRFPIWGDVVLVFLSSSLCVSWRLVLVVSGAHSSDPRMFCLLFCTCFVECDWPGLHVRRHWLHLTGALGFFFFCAVSLVCGSCSPWDPLVLELLGLCSPPPAPILIPSFHPAGLSAPLSSSLREFSHAAVSVVLFVAALVGLSACATRR